MQLLTCKGCEDVSLFENDEVEKAWAILLANKEKTFTIVQFAPSVRVALGEKFGMQSGEDGIGKIVTVLRGMGADLVVDTAIAEDVAVLSETKRLKSRKYFGERTPLFSSKCSAWVAYAQENYEDLEISAMPSSSAISGALLKDYYKKQTGKTVRVISVEPCEEKRCAFGVDASVTVEDFADMLMEVEEVGTDVRLLKKQPLDMPFGAASGGGFITDGSGGLAEAVARCLIAEKSTENLQKFAYSGFYGSKSRREAVLTIGDDTWRFAVTCGKKATDALIEDVRNGTAVYDYVEVSLCENGCVSGDGLGFDDEGEIEEESVRKLRWQGLKNLDMHSAVRFADTSLAATALEKKWEAWLRKKMAGLIEEDGEIEPVELTEGWEEESGEEKTAAIDEKEPVVEAAALDETADMAEIDALEDIETATVPEVTNADVHSESTEEGEVFKTVEDVANVENTMGEAGVDEEEKTPSVIEEANAEDAIDEGEAEDDAITQEIEESIEEPKKVEKQEVQNGKNPNANMQRHGHKSKPDYRKLKRKKRR